MRFGLSLSCEARSRKKFPRRESCEAHSAGEPHAPPFGRLGEVAPTREPIGSGRRANQIRGNLSQERSHLELQTVLTSCPTPHPHDNPKQLIKMVRFELPLAPLAC